MIEVDRIVVEKGVSGLVTQDVDLEDLSSVAFLIFENGYVFVIQNTNDFSISSRVVHCEA